MSFSFGSVCSGIEAASVAFQPLGWEGAPKSENDLAVVVYLKNSNLYTTTLILDFDKAKWLRDQLNNVITAAPVFINNNVALKTPGEF